MTNSRHAIRHPCNLPATLQHRGAHCPCSVENLSTGGTLVRLKDSTREPLRRGDNCLLTIGREPRAAVQVAGRVVHHGFTLVGLRFLEPDRETKRALGVLLEQIGAPPHHPAMVPAHAHPPSPDGQATMGEE